MRRKTNLDDYVTVEPWPHQREAYDFLVHRGYGALFADMGTGKTLVAVGLIGAKSPTRTVIVCPKVMQPVWARELDRLMDRPSPIHNLVGPLKYRVKVIDEATRSPDCSILIVNYDVFRYSSIMQALQRYAPNMVILDESHRIKSPGSQITKRITILGKQADFRFILTGTPAADKPVDVFSQMRFLDGSILGTAYEPFLQRYTLRERRMAANGGKYDVILNYRNQEELQRILYDHSFRVTNEVLYLPETLDTVIPITLDDSTAKLYQQMRRDSVLVVGETEKAAENVLSKLLYLQQLTSGFVVDDNTRAVLSVDESKMAALEDLLTDLGPEPVVVFYRFSEDARRIHRAAKNAGRQSFELSGSADQRAGWESSPAAVLAVQIQAGGAGVNLVHASKVVYYSLSFSLTDYRQSRARSHRPGQTKPVHYYHLITQGYVDEDIYTALSGKHDVVQYLIEQYK